MYANSDTTQNTITALSNSGQKIDFKYNSTGDATEMDISGIDFIITDKAYLEFETGFVCYMIYYEFSSLMVIQFSSFLLLPEKTSATSVIVMYALGSISWIIRRIFVT